MSTSGPPSAGPVEEGQICDPDNISDTDQVTAKAKALACQLSSNPNDAKVVLMPGSFQNALKGDIILSPGSDAADNIIGALLRALDPPQHHSHSGFMTLNYFEITHCTASPERISDPHNIGIGGIDPNVLQYAWPGSISQTIDNAVGGEKWNEPTDPTGNKYYTIQGFTPEPLGFTDNNEFTTVYPLVIKPFPDNESAARPLLRKAADLARSKGARVNSDGNLIQKGGAYYCFYGYTKPEIALGFSDPAPASAGWAQGLSPAVCSSFIWLNMKANKINCVGPNSPETMDELSQAAQANGATVDATTLDGLFYYSAQVRQKAAQVLNTSLNDLISKGQGVLGGAVLSLGIGKGIANQILNMFAFNNPDMFGPLATNWQNPGDGNAVSPDNIQFWNPPYFGYAEPVQYLEKHLEQYTVSRWKSYTVTGIISGTVTDYNGNIVSRAYVYVDDAHNTYTDGNGYFELDNVPAGTYNLKVSATIPVNDTLQQVANGPSGPADQGQAIDTSKLKQDYNYNVQVVLNPLPNTFRQADISYDCNYDHSGGIGQQAGPIDTRTKTTTLYLNPDATIASYCDQFIYGTLYYVNFGLSLQLLQDLSIQVKATLEPFDYSGNPEPSPAPITFNVPAGGVYGQIFTFEVDGVTDLVSWTNGPIKFSIQVNNNQQS